LGGNTAIYDILLRQASERIQGPGYGKTKRRYLFRSSHELQILLVHPGGPFWAKRDEGSWSIPRGEYYEAEDALAAAKRELREETGIVVAGEFLELGTFKQPSGKLISAWAIERDFDPVELRSNTCSVEWSPKRTVDVPEVDHAAWFSITEAVDKITKGQLPIMQALAKKLSVRIPGPSEKLPSGKRQGSPL
jgi:predicted NUDIX family NTP pyrophosphohydrolase